MSRLIYSLLLCLAFPFISLRFLWRCYKNPAYTEQWYNRFGVINEHIIPGGILIHAVSLGETVAVSALVKRLLQAYPHLPVYCSTNTLTGANKIKALYGDRVQQLYLPYDYPWTMTSFLKKLKPKMVLLVESEIWPNLIQTCAKKHIPLFLVNARLSPHSVMWHHRLRFFSTPVLQKITHIAAQSTLDAERFRTLGVAPEKITLCGNLKFIVNFPENFEEKVNQLSLLFKQNHPIWIAASTHDAEESIILEAHRIIQKHIPEARLLMVPRHPERFDHVAAFCKQQGFNVCRRSAATPVANNVDIILGDTMGELLQFYKIGDVALVCGSLAPIGGHSLLEPAAVRVATLTGPHHFNTKEIADELLARHALKIVHDAATLSTEVISLLQNPTVRDAMSASGRKFVDENQHTVDNVLHILNPYLNPKDNTHT